MNKYINYGHCTVRRAPKYLPEAEVWVRLSPVAQLYGLNPRYGQGTATNYVVATFLAVVQLLYWGLPYLIRLDMPRWVQRGSLR